MVLGFIAGFGAVFGAAEGIRASQSKSRREEHRSRKQNLVVSCPKSSNHSRVLEGRQVVLSGDRLFIDTGLVHDAPFGHPFCGYFLRYPDAPYSGMVSTITPEAPIMNWIFVDRETYQVKFGNRLVSEGQMTGPWDVTRQDRRLTFGGWEGFCAVLEDGGFWGLYFDRDGDLLRGMCPGRVVIEVELIRRELKTQRPVFEVPDPKPEQQQQEQQQQQQQGAEQKPAPAPEQQEPIKVDEKQAQAQQQQGEQVPVKVEEKQPQQQQPEPAKAEARQTKRPQEEPEQRPRPPPKQDAKRSQQQQPRRQEQQACQQVQEKSRRNGSVSNGSVPTKVVRVGLPRGPRPEGSITGRSVQSGRSMQSAKTVQSGKSVQSNKSMQSNRSMQSNKTVQSNKSLQSNKSAQSGKSLQSNNSEESQGSSSGSTTGGGRSRTRRGRRSPPETSSPRRQGPTPSMYREIAPLNVAGAARQQERPPAQQQPANAESSTEAGRARPREDALGRPEEGRRVGATTAENIEISFPKLEEMIRSLAYMSPSVEDSDEDVSLPPSPDVD